MAGDPKNCREPQEMAADPRNRQAGTQKIANDPNNDMGLQEWQGITGMTGSQKMAWYPAVSWSPKKMVGGYGKWQTIAGRPTNGSGPKNLKGSHEISGELRKWHPDKAGDASGNDWGGFWERQGRFLETARNVSGNDRVDGKWQGFPSNGRESQEMAGRIPGKAGDPRNGKGTKEMAKEPWK